MEQSLNSQYKDTKNSANKAVNSFADEVKSGATKAVSTVSDKLKAGADELSDTTGITASQIKERFALLKEQAGDKIEVASDFVKKYPFACIAGATVLGYAAGKILTRKR